MPEEETTKRERDEEIVKKSIRFTESDEKRRRLRIQRTIGRKAERMAARKAALRAIREWSREGAYERSAT